MWLDNANVLAPASPPEADSLRTAADAIRLIGDELAQATVEILRLVHLDGNGKVIAIEEQRGNHDMLYIAVSPIIRAACLRGTRRLLIAHNHPSGDPTPSLADRLATRNLAELLRALDIAMVDHLVMARQGVASFRALGLI